MFVSDGHNFYGSYFLTPFWLSGKLFTSGPFRGLALSHAGSLIIFGFACFGQVRKKKNKEKRRTQGRKDDESIKVCIIARDGSARSRCSE